MRNRELCRDSIPRYGEWKMKKKLNTKVCDDKQMFDWAMEAFTAIGKRFSDLEKRIVVLEESK